MSDSKNKKDLILFEREKRSSEQMESSRTSIKANRLDRESSNRSAPALSSGPSLKFSTKNILSAIGSRFFSVNAEQKKIEESSDPQREPSKHKTGFSEDTKEQESIPHVKKTTRQSQSRWPKSDDIQLYKPYDKEILRAKAKFNSQMGSILRNWMGLVYVILILRMNLIKLILEKFPNLEEKDIQLQDQIMEESKTIYNIIRYAQSYSQERSLYLWTHLEKLLMSYLFLRNAMKDMKGKDWKGAAAKLVQVQAELTRLQNLQKEFQTEDKMKGQLEKLQAMAKEKNNEMMNLIQEITDYKKRELQMRGQILLNMKSYKDLKTKRKYLMNVEQEMNQLKINQLAAAKEYTSKIEVLREQIEQKEREINKEREESKKIKARLEGLGDFTEKKSLSALTES